MKKIMFIAIMALGLTQCAHAQAWRDAPYVDVPTVYTPPQPYTTYGGDPRYYSGGGYQRGYQQGRQQCRQPYNYGCDGYNRGTTTVVVVQPSRQMCGGYYGGNAVWNMDPLSGTMIPNNAYYDPYGNYVDPYYNQQALPAGRRAAIIGLQAAQMVGSEFINLAIDNVMYGQR